MGIKQVAMLLAFGASGITVPDELGNSVQTSQLAGHRLVQPILHVPAFAAAVMTLEVSVNDGGTWTRLTTDAKGKATFPTAGTYTGGERIVLEPMLPGTRIRATGPNPSPVAAAITSNHTAALADVTLTAKDAGPAGNLISVTYALPAEHGAAAAVAVTGRDIVVSLATAGDTAASKVFNMTAALADVTLTAKAPGAAGNDVSCVFVLGAVGAPLAVTVPTPNHISVQLATVAGPAAASTAAEVKAAIEALAEAAALVTVTVEGNGSGVANELIEAHLEGGVDGGGSTTTAAQAVAAINANAAAAALVTAAAEGVGSGVLNALAKANLAGGEDDHISVFFGI